MGTVLIGTPVLLIGGTEMQVLALARSLQNAGYQVIICCYHEYDDLMVREAQAVGARVMLMGYRRSDGLLSLLGRLKALFRELRPDVAHIQYVAPGLVPIVAARLAQVSTIFATVHQTARAYGWRERRLLRTAAYLTNLFFCVSRAAENSWFGDDRLLDPKQPIGGRRHFTLYNAVDLARIAHIVDETDVSELRASLGIMEGPLVGVVGRLRGEKGQGFLLEAMAQVIKEIPLAQLLVVGEGPDQERLTGQAEGLGIAPRIRWLGRKSPQEVFQLYSLMEVVAIPSLYEGFGLSAAEAMAASRPVVASRVDGLPEIVEEGETGYLVPAGSPSQLASALIRLLGDPERAATMGGNGRRRAAKLFSPERFTEAILMAYRSVSAQGGASHRSVEE